MKMWPVRPLLAIPQYIWCPENALAFPPVALLLLGAPCGSQPDPPPPPEVGCLQSNLTRRGGGVGRHRPHRLASKRSPTPPSGTSLGHNLTAIRRTDSQPQTRHSAQHTSTEKRSKRNSDCPQISVFFSQLRFFVTISIVLLLVLYYYYYYYYYYLYCTIVTITKFPALLCHKGFVVLKRCPVQTLILTYLDYPRKFLFDAIFIQIWSSLYFSFPQDSFRFSNFLVLFSACFFPLPFLRKY